MNVTVLTGARAVNKLACPAFCLAWAELAARCPWTTAYQRAEFVATWYRTYHEEYEPVLVLGHTDREPIAGMWFLAYDKAHDKLVPAGTCQSEYHAWLANPELSDDFVVNALSAIKTLGRGRRITFTFLAPKCSLGWIPKAREAGVFATVGFHRRGLMDVRDGEAVARSLRKKSNKSRIGRLKRFGRLSFEQLRLREELDAVLPSIIEHCDLRQGAMYDSMPFQSDPRKREFYLTMMEQPELIHATVLKLDNEVIAAHLGIISDETVSLGVISYSPFHAKHSPGKLLLLYLAKLLHEQGYQFFDLTPGGDYKERFAETSDEVAELDIFFNVRCFATHWAYTAAARVSKPALVKLGIDPPRFKKQATETLRKLLSKRVLGSVHSNGRTPRASERNAYRLALPSIMNRFESSVTFRRNCISDLLRFEPNNSKGSNLNGFLRDALHRLEFGQVAYTYAEDEVLLCCSWCILSKANATDDTYERLKLPEHVPIVFNVYENHGSSNHGGSAALIVASLMRCISEAEKLGAAEIVYLSDPKQPLDRLIDLSCVKTDAHEHEVVAITCAAK